MSDPRHTECSNLTKARWAYLYAIMKIMCSPSYHHNGPVATHALGHMMYGLITGRAHCFHDCIYIYIYKKCMYVYINIYTCIHIYIYIYLYMYICIYVNICIYICMYVYMYSYMYVYINKS